MSAEVKLVRETSVHPKKWVLYKAHYRDRLFKVMFDDGSTVNVLAHDDDEAMRAELLTVTNQTSIAGVAEMMWSDAGAWDAVLEQSA